MSVDMQTLDNVRDPLDVIPLGRLDVPVSDRPGTALIEIIESAPRASVATAEVDDDSDEFQSGGQEKIKIVIKEDAKFETDAEFQQE